MDLKIGGYLRDGKVISETGGGLYIHGIEYIIRPWNFAALAVLGPECLQSLYQRGDPGDIGIGEGDAEMAMAGANRRYG